MAPVGSTRNNDLSTNPARAVGFTSRGYGSKMGKCICCEWWAGDEQPPVIITAYRTSKIEKYWSAE
jgi:hypothetical protein